MKRFTHWLLAATLTLCCAALFSSCSDEDSAANPDPQAEQVKGTWWALVNANDAPSLNASGISYSRVGYALLLNEDGTGYGAVLFFDDENSEPLKVIGGESYAPLTFTSTQDGQINVTLNSASSEYAEYFGGATATYQIAGATLECVTTENMTLGRPSAAMNAMITSWLEEPTLEASASNYNINDADFTPTTWRQQEAIYIWNGKTRITASNRENPDNYSIVNLPWYEGEKQTNLPNGFCDSLTPENGWEWVFNRCGSTNIPNNNFFGVYNKYTGILRVFYYMPSGVQTGNDHLWQISMTNNLANHYLWGYGLPSTQNIKNRKLLGKTGEGTQIEYVTPWVEATSDDGLIVPKDGWWAFDIDLSLYRPDADHSLDNIKLEMRSWNVNHVSLHSTMKASIEGSIKQKVEQTQGPSASKVVQGVCLIGEGAANLMSACLYAQTGDIARAWGAVASTLGNGSSFAGLFGDDSKPFEGQISLGMDGTIDTEGVIQGSATNIGVASPTLYLKDFFQNYSPSFGQGVWNIKNHPTVYSIKDLKYYFILRNLTPAGYACFPYFLDPSSIEVELNPNVFPEDEIEWIQVEAIGNASRRMGMAGTDRFRTALGLQPLYRGESEANINTKVYGSLFTAIESFDQMCILYGNELSPYFDYLHASKDKGGMDFPALIIHEEPSDGKEQIVYGRGYQGIYAIEPPVLTYTRPYTTDGETLPASICLPPLEVNVMVLVKMKGREKPFAFCRNYLPEIKDITLNQTYGIFVQMLNHKLNPKQEGHRSGYDYQVERLHTWFKSLWYEFPD